MSIYGFRLDSQRADFSGFSFLQRNKTGEIQNACSCWEMMAFSTARLQGAERAAFLVTGLSSKATTNGLLTSLISFFSTNGANPSAGLTLGTDDSFYGTTWDGGYHISGTVFQITTNGVLTTLNDFSNTNGAFPSAALTLGNDGNFYGTTKTAAFIIWGRCSK